ncbi:MAG: [FeFe] hydrogenase H-cluster radical SAM maturase HydE [Bacteroidales bacterium]|nr:[FeFe] hydrogenase H-cluster radical SAM maturase HydE [Bacteroidales bacterium]MBK7174278.1 [FeFe] hydrogenase H-cluster radical SAM maturase HydE [Bacteroidales bacterium]
MQPSVKEILDSGDFSRENLITLLGCAKEERELIFERGAAVKKEYVGNKVYFRGLVELSNICSKNCYYCGIRRGNKVVDRYFVTDDEVLEAARFALDEGYGSMVIQSGERTDKVFTGKVTNLLQKIKQLSSGKLGITLSMGEQSEETFRQWFEAGAHRYLLRIESSNPELYYRIHPRDSHHDFEYRLRSLKLLREIGYNVGTGVMIGLPFQTLDDLANDLLFFKELDIDMAGMGPYIEHKDTPLYEFRNQLIPKSERFYLSLKMVALLRIMMKDINIAATTAMQTLDKQGREKALKVGANIIMPNLTPVKYREGYLLYEDKPCINEEASECRNCLEARIHIAGDEIGFGEWGDSKHFAARKVKG